MEELHKRVSQVVREVLQDEMHELKDLLASLLQQQAGFSEEINKTLSMNRAPTPKTSKGQRLAPAPSPRSFTDHHGGSGQLTLGQLQERHAEWLRSVSDGMAFMPARSIPLPSLDEQTSSKSILPLAIPIPASHSNRAAAHSYGEPELVTMKNSNPTLGVPRTRSEDIGCIIVHENSNNNDSNNDNYYDYNSNESSSALCPRPPDSCSSAPCAPGSPRLVLQTIHEPMQKHKSMPACVSARRASVPSTPELASRTLNQRWAARDEHCVMAEAEDKQFKNDTQEEASLGRYGQCMSTTAKALLKLFGVLPCQGCVGYLSPAIVYLLLLLAAVGPLIAFSDPHRHVVWSAFNGSLMCLGMMMALFCNRRNKTHKLVAPECCPLRLYSQWISTIPSDLLYAYLFFFMQIALMGNYLRQAAGQNCENYDSWSLQLSHVVAAAVFSMLMFLKLHVLSCLDLMIDDFSRQYAEHGNAEHGIWQWSLIQATLNQASNRLEGSFLVSFTAITAGFATLTADSLLGSPEMLDRGQACAGKASWLLLPMLMIISKGLLLIYVLLRAARISEKCDRTKQFINSLLPPPAEDSCYLDPDRSYLVRYIDDSAAGFCIQGGRVSVFAVMKLFYLMCALTFAIVTHVYKT